VFGPREPAMNRGQAWARTPALQPVWRPALHFNFRGHGTRPHPRLAGDLHFNLPRTNRASASALLP
jgi:hypothetical protein